MQTIPPTRLQRATSLCTREAKVWRNFGGGVNGRIGGICEECIQIEFEENELIKKRVALLEQLDKQYEQIEKRLSGEREV